MPLWRRQWQPTPVLLPGKSHGRRSLVGCSPWRREESDTTERLHFHFSLSSIGEGNGNPLQCSCLENPRDGGGWWAAVYGVTQSRTRLKRLSSSTMPLCIISLGLELIICAAFTGTHSFIFPLIHPTCVHVSMQPAILSSIHPCIHPLNRDLPSTYIMSG